MIINFYIQNKNEINKIYLRNIKYLNDNYKLFYKKMSYRGNQKTGAAAKNEFNPKKYDRYGLSEDEVMEIKDAFDLFDSDKSGQIDKSELKNALQNLGIDNKNQTLHNMMQDLDKDESGTISFEEFIEMMTAKMSDRDTKDDLKKVFRLFIGDDSTDKISVKHLRRVANDLQGNFTIIISNYA